MLVAYDLNRLKLLNDRYGHATGDAAIRRMAEVIRASGLAGPERHYRIGGDEFATIAVAGDPDRARAVLAGLFQTWHRPGDGPDFFEFSYGVAAFNPNLDRNLHDLLSRADAAMYQHKSSLKGVQGGFSSSAASSQ